MQENHLDINSPIEITKSLVETAKRFEFLPSISEKRFMDIEAMAYGIARNTIDDYSGGYWEFVTLSNGGKFMYLRQDENVVLNNPMNYFTKSVDCETAGIAITALVYARLAEGAHISDDVEQLKIFGNHFHHLRDYALSMNNENGAAILRFLD